MNKRALALLVSLMASCAWYEQKGWVEWSGSDCSGGENDLIARLDWSGLPGVITSIDGYVLGAGYKSAKLCPGRHVIDYADYPAEFGQHPKGTGEMELQPGHLYEFRLELCFWCKPRRYAAWVDDKTTGDVVWGKRQDWPSWWW